MINLTQYIENLALVSLTRMSARLSGASVVECGTWKGGMAPGTVEIGGTARPYIFLDSFEGLPPAKSLTAKWLWGGRPIRRRRAITTIASLAEFESTIRKARRSGATIDVRKGFFEDTFAHFEPPQIGVLRLDADWYAPTMLCLEKFWDKVLPSGIIIIDDYYTWDGCSRAVHEFLARRNLPERIRQGPVGRVAYILKEEVS